MKGLDNIKNNNKIQGQEAETITIDKNTRALSIEVKIRYNKKIIGKNLSQDLIRKKKKKLIQLFVKDAIFRIIYGEKHAADI